MISICIPTYRGGSRIRRLFGHWPHDAREDVEIVVFDDGSPGDEGAEIVKALDGVPVQSRRCLGLPTNRGPVACISEVVRASSGRIILQLDDDVVLPPGLVPLARDLLGDGTSPRVPNLGVLSWRSQGTRPGQSAAAIVGLMEPATELAGYCMAYRREVFDEVNGVDTRFKFYCSDSDFALRVALAGHPCYRVWWPLVSHEEHGSIDDDNRRLLAERDLGAFRDKWGASGQEMERRALARLRGERA